MQGLWRRPSLAVATSLPRRSRTPACVEASSCTQGLWRRPSLAVATSLPRRSRTPARVEASSCMQGLWCCPDLRCGATSLPRLSRTHSLCGGIVMHARFVASSFPRCRNLVGVEPHPTWRHRHARKVCGVVLTSLSQPRCLVGVEPTAPVEASSCTQGLWCCPDLRCGATSLPRRSRTHSPCGGIVMHARLVVLS